MDDKPTFYLLPNRIHPSSAIDSVFPQELTNIVQSLDILIAETPKEARSFLGLFFKAINRPVSTCPVLALNEHTGSEGLNDIVEQIVEGGKKMGFVSDAGLPIVADPGAKLVKALKERGIRVCAIPGPSSITHSLLLSGFSGQAFTFHGYLAKMPDDLRKNLKQVERDCYENRATQIFIERPYRNNVTLSIILETLSPETQLCVAVELMGSKERVITKTVEQWRESAHLDLHKKLVIYLIAAGEILPSRNNSRGNVVKEKRSFRRKR